MPGIYFHIPFCIGKCIYCAFFSSPLKSENQLDQYLGALEGEINLRAPLFADRTVDSIYFGGGTPSLARPARLKSLLDRFKKHTGGISPDCEITLEANPETLSLEKLDGFLHAGFNRISIGVQSFDPGALAFLERNHDPGQGTNAVALAKQAGFKNVGLDLITALPSPFHAAFRDDLEKAIALSPEHISAYLLSAEKPSRLFEKVCLGNVTLPDDDAQADVFLEIHEALTHAGYAHYEVSNFARPGFFSRHNSAYWTGEQYLGLGAGAHSFLDQNKKTIRSANVSDLLQYQAMVEAGKPPIGFSEVIDEEMKVREQIMLALRTKDGIDPGQFGEIKSVLESELDRFAQEGLYEKADRRYHPTPKGYLMADAVAVSLWEKLESDPEGR